MKYAIVHKHPGDDPLPEIPLLIFYGLPRPFDTQRDAHLYAKKVFGSKHDSMAVRIVSYAHASKIIAVHVDIRSGRLRPKNGKNGKEGYYVDESRRSYAELRPGLMDGYKREVGLRREAVERRKEMAAVKAAAVAAINVGVNTVKADAVKEPTPASAKRMTDKEMRLAIYQETGRYIAPTKPKPDGLCDMGLED